jgi:hypothetical protein
MNSKKIAVRSTSFHEDVERALADSGLATARLHPADSTRHTVRGLTIARCLASVLFDMPAEYTAEFPRTALPEYSCSTRTVEIPATPPLVPLPLLQLIAQRETEVHTESDEHEASTDSEAESDETDTESGTPVALLPAGGGTLAGQDPHLQEVELFGSASLETDKPDSGCELTPVEAPLAQYVTPGITKVRFLLSSTVRRIRLMQGSSMLVFRRLH